MALPEQVYEVALDARRILELVDEESLELFARLERHVHVIAQEIACGAETSANPSAESGRCRARSPLRMRRAAP